MPRLDRTTALNASFALVFGLVLAILGLVVSLVVVGFPVPWVTTNDLAVALLATVAVGGATIAIPLYLVFVRTALGPTVPGE